MKKLYAVLIAVICASVILLVAAFLYMDINRRASFYYDIYSGDTITSTVILDKYNTEDKVVYKSATMTPFNSTTDQYKRKLSVEKKGFKVHSYNKAYLSGGADLNVFIRSVNASINFLVLGHSDFAYAERMPVSKDFIIFEPKAPISYFTLMDKYSFNTKDVRTIPILTHSYAFLPPYQDTLQIRYIKEDSISINSKKMKALHYKIKGSDKTEILLWVNRWTHAPLLVKIPKEKFMARWSDVPDTIEAKTYKADEGPYTEELVTFKNKDISLAGVLTIPDGEGPFPAALLVWGRGPRDREGLGIFTSMAAEFAKKGIATLRYDKRGVGESEGSLSRLTGEEIQEDLLRSIDFLLEREDIDNEKITILGHSEGGYHAASIAASCPDIATCVILGGIDIVDLPDTELEMMLSFDRAASEWDKRYLEDIAGCVKDATEVLNSGKDWAILLHKRVFLKKKRLDKSLKPLEVIRKVKTPILILHAGEDTITTSEHISSLDEALKESGHQNYEIIHLKKLNHFFGDLINDNEHRAHILLDKRVVPSITKWLKKKEEELEDIAVTDAAAAQLEVPAILDKDIFIEEGGQ